MSSILGVSKMSRVGQSSLNIPEGVEVKQNEQYFWVKVQKVS